MFCDAHCHPFDLLEYLGKDGLESCIKGTACAASSCSLEQFEYNESLARKAAALRNAQVLPCFAAHPQLPAFLLKDLLPLLESLAREKRLAAVGEAGFDLFNDGYRETENIQDEVFAVHLDIAIKYSLPIVIHARRAMHKIFFHAKSLRKIPSVIFHSWPGTTGEGEALLRRGVNAFFSFGAAITNNRKESRRSCALFPAERLLFETDAPYLPPRGKTFSSWNDLPLIYQAAAALRKAAGSPGSCLKEIVILCRENFFRAFQADKDS